MKLTFVEHANCFEISFEAETKSEVVELARFGINKTKKINSICAFFNQGGTASGSVIIAKKRRPYSHI